MTADTVESLQLEMAARLLARAADLLADIRATSVQLGFLGDRMTEALRGVVRITHNRGHPPSGSGAGREEARDPREGAAER
ncbi:hypothetical protein [Embleya scabrispora]|uniref:hypothetical protein n=1 Tax=Embleya scabrispora TaxID=159449 RepID=UPI001912C95D|nr:hypothetical protein [Embleya scabrispora]